MTGDPGSGGGEAVPRIYVVDDNERLRKDLHERLDTAFAGFKHQPKIRSRTQWVWDLFGDTDSVPAVPADYIAPHDIVITDLYPSGYWAKVPGPKPYSPANPGVDDAANIVNASYDMVHRFLRPLQARASVLLITFVPRWLELEAEEDPVGQAHLDARARRLRADINAQGFSGVFYKLDQSGSPDVAPEPGVADTAETKAVDRQGKNLADVNFADPKAFDDVVDAAVHLVRESRRGPDA